MAITCTHCGRQSEGMPAPPLAGETGRLVQEHTCAACWAEWQQLIPNYINHLGLRVHLPADRARLYEAMREYLNIPPTA